MENGINKKITIEQQKKILFCLEETGIVDSGLFQQEVRISIKSMNNKSFIYKVEVSQNPLLEK